MNILVTGTAGFIGFFVASKLLSLGHVVIGLDNVNDYYDVNLKESRLKILHQNKNFIEARLDLVNRVGLEELFRKYKPVRVLNLAAQAGVRYSFENPYAYVDSNLVGFVNLEEQCRHNQIEHFVFASTASVYGANNKMPWDECDGCNHQLSLYAATKKANEVIAHSYSHLFNIPTTGLRFFNVYGPWGRPDMALFIFVRNIFEGKAIDVYNNGQMVRDFTYVEDIAEGVCKVLLGKVPMVNQLWNSDSQYPDPSTSGVAPFRIYNIGNSRPVELMRYIKIMEDEIGKKAIINFMPIQPGEVIKSEADNLDLYKEFDFKPKVNVEEGVHNFVKWYREYYKY
ncbi:UDP-glucuronate 4-epimerase [Succinivibrio dextrinosolvens]|uniref:NAD-dependent epimerase/dehydratase family protein n=1 Tax=Succinivibrio dextrinosolvens TaxID=83771 RepID=UPI0008E6B0A8|nr:NAD-dependent epimerase/dehydratase family protein [Succinivibrio dextrinosolvens]SFS89169.1 UDP-glucuronate 4-epimerase [Succinivibrio dextrinosolvens]